MTLLDKVIEISSNLAFEIREISKCTQTSRTKFYIQTTLTDSVKELEKQNKKLNGYRNTLESPIELGEEINTVYDEIWAISEAIGEVQYHLMHNDILAALEVLDKINKSIKGR